MVIFKYRSRKNFSCVPFLQCRKTNNNTYEGTTWQIKFKLDDVDESATYKLRVALATAHSSELQVWNFIIQLTLFNFLFLIQLSPFGHCLFPIIYLHNVRQKANNNFILKKWKVRFLK